MANDISGFGTLVTLIALGTFSEGLVITQFADDSDPLDMASVKIADTAMGVNGDLVKWAKAATLPMVLNVIAGSPDDINLGILAEANRVGKGKTSAQDEITATIVYPDGDTIILSGGAMTDAAFGRSISSAGRFKSKAYAFSFQNKVGV